MKAQMTADMVQNSEGNYDITIKDENGRITAEEKDLAFQQAITKMDEYLYGGDQ